MIAWRPNKQLRKTYEQLYKHPNQNHFGHAGLVATCDAGIADPFVYAG